MENPVHKRLKRFVDGIFWYLVKIQIRATQIRNRSYDIA